MTYEQTRAQRAKERRAKRKATSHQNYLDLMDEEDAAAEARGEARRDRTED